MRQDNVTFSRVTGLYAVTDFDEPSETATPASFEPTFSANGQDVVFEPVIVALAPPLSQNFHVLRPTPYSPAPAT